MERVFLDANVMFSAAWSEDNGLLMLWTLSRVELITSLYAVNEARRNLIDREKRERLGRLLREVQIHEDPVQHERLFSDVELPEKDQPILAAAIDAGATHLLTGDKTHFGALYGLTIEGVLVLSPGSYLKGRG
ncbi:MAG: PIN domain-containing protein [Phycisphaeraceae bacterium]|nr:MAG: PIN domain-containing protein [Phycisphaeraceae bacterium]